MYNALRSDNENMARELCRLEKLNKQLRDKVIKSKQKIAEQEGIIAGLQSALVLNTNKSSQSNSQEGSGKRPIHQKAFNSHRGVAPGPQLNIVSIEDRR